ncbi:hypothetical protein F3Y22_tig00111584pilonHSYRG00081 [Hibiscus syriacus]|uniref:Uncharacterized protein n=1 Tax=Hibiscus syriacus TaxID=106335 RepID=A0A6A2XLT8_HIBSY|nr:hypothetical protein F3Y22_tig00111584pilonHSYRG00081 [Hibiscus syriacus]
MLRVLVVLDSKPTRLSEQSINALSNFLPGYLMDVVHCIPEDDVQAWRLLDSNWSLPSDTSMRHATDGCSQINATISLLLLMYKDIKVQKIISSFRTEIGSILQSIASLQSSEDKMTLEERHKFQCLFEQLKVVTSASPAG